MSDSLLAHLSHDLRNPGTTLVSCVELLRDVVRDPDGREAVEDAQLALDQLKNAWARVDVLAGHFPPHLHDEVELAPIFEHVTKAYRATCSGTDDATGPSGLRFVLDALLEATRQPTIEMTLEDGTLVLRISDHRGVIADPELRTSAFEIERQSDMKSVGRYSRFLGLSTAHRVAEHIGAELIAAEDCLFRLTLSR